MSHPLAEEDLTALLETAFRAGDAILRHYYGEIDVEVKEDRTPLTQADLASHKVIVDALKRLFPEIPVISEEGRIAEYEERRTWERFWLVDPLDGTKEFIQKNGEFTVNIALVEGAVPVYGIVHAPAKRLTWYGMKGLGSYRLEGTGAPERIYSEVPDIRFPLRIVSSRSHRSGNLEEELRSRGLIPGEIIPAGSSLKFCLVAEGTADLYPRLGPTMEWDTAAGDAVFRYSGRDEIRSSELLYNKESLKNPGFIIGL